MVEENPDNIPQPPPIIQPTPELLPSVQVRGYLPPMRLLLEMAAVMAIAVVPDIYNSAASLIWSSSKGAASFAYMQSWVGMRGICVTVAVLYIIQSSGDRWAQFGIGWPRPVTDIPWAILIFISSLVIYFVLGILYGLSGLYTVTESTQQEVSALFEYPSQPTEYAILVAVSLINGFAEELVMRAYLITRLNQLLRSKVSAILITSILFASYHIYQGWFSTVNIFLTGLVMGIAFVYLKRLWPVVLAHAIWDIFAMLPSIWSYLGYE